MPDSSRFPAPLVRFVDLFNREEFWESHEVLEGPWREGRSTFYHGLILYASAFVHVQRNNPHGVVAQLRKAERALAAFGPVYLGVDVAAILEEARAVRRRVDGEARQDPSSAWRERIRFPRLRLDPDRLRGDEPELSR